MPDEESMNGEESMPSLADVDGRSEEEAKLVSRRSFLSGALAGGALGLTAAAATGIGVYKISEAQAQKSLDDAEAEILRLQGLITLYEKQDRLGLDDILRTGMSAMAVPLEVVERGALVLKQGLDQVERGLASLGEAMSKARIAFDWLEARVSAVAAGIAKLEAALARAASKFAGSPVAEALSGLLSDVLDLLPFDWGDRVRDAFENLVGLLRSVDELVLGINTHLLEPVEKKWFSTEEGMGLDATFLEPLVAHVLDPLEAHLTALATLTDTWQARLVAPTQEAVSERERLQAEIARYRREHGFK